MRLASQDVEQRSPFRSVALSTASSSGIPSIYTRAASGRMPGRSRGAKSALSPLCPAKGRNVAVRTLRWAPDASSVIRKSPALYESNVRRCPFLRQSARLKANGANDFPTDATGLNYVPYSPH